MPQGSSAFVCLCTYTDCLLCALGCSPLPSEARPPPRLCFGQRTRCSPVFVSYSQLESLHIRMHQSTEYTLFFRRMDKQTGRSRIPCKKVSWPSHLGKHLISCDIRGQTAPPQQTMECVGGALTPGWEIRSPVGRKMRGGGSLFIR